MTDEVGLRHERLEAEVRIEAGLDAVWRALTVDIGAWWPHTFEDRPFRIVLEPQIGGRFYEQFDEAGAGALYATVTYLEPSRILRISGPMGLGGAALYVKTFRLEAADGTTTVRTTADILGALTAETVEGYRVGGLEVLTALRAHLDAARIA